jgi:hypothetical protein
LSIILSYFAENSFEPAGAEQREMDALIQVALLDKSRKAWPEALKKAQQAGEMSSSTSSKMTFCRPS